MTARIGFMVWSDERMAFQRFSQKLDGSKGNKSLEVQNMRMNSHLHWNSIGAYPPPIWFLVPY
jgi:hypothetical protein